MEVLVTGGCGFVGSHVVDELLAAGHTVRVLDDLSASTATHLPRGVRLDVADVTDPTLVAAAVEEVDAVCHQAAKVGLGRGVDDLADYVRANDLGTAVLLSAMATAGVPRLVTASSMVVYGEGGYTCADHGPVRPPPRSPEDLRAGRFEPHCPGCGTPLAVREVDESAPLDPRNGYAATKVAQEHLATTWADATGGTAVALRYHNVYGRRLPRDTPYAGVAALFRSALARGEPPRVFEDGAQLRDFVHVRDVARANRLALEHPRPGPVGALTAYNVASGRPSTVGSMAEELSRALDGPAPVVTGQSRVGDVRHIVASPARAEATLGFRAEVDLADGLADFAVETEGLTKS
jgi:dTDP-L-rhamnose 4-epimerase